MRALALLLVAPAAFAQFDTRSLQNAAQEAGKSAGRSDRGSSCPNDPR
ncbi:MAG TPA: hypothetical protein VLW85_09255 [Myxococcales bacterium]|nr:hypothetical protein [Myxococcales bacterium]